MYAFICTYMLMQSPLTSKVSSMSAILRAIGWCRRFPDKLAAPPPLLCFTMFGSVINPLAGDFSSRDLDLSSRDPELGLDPRPVTL